MKDTSHEHNHNRANRLGFRRRGRSEIVFETGKLAKQADAVVVRSGETMILATAVGRPDARPDADFFPLTVDVEEKMYAAGRSRAASSSARAARRSARRSPPA